VSGRRDAAPVPCPSGNQCVVRGRYSTRNAASPFVSGDRLLPGASSAALSRALGPKVSEEPANLPWSPQFEDADTGLEGIERGVKVSTAVFRIAPDPTNELEVQPLRATLRLDRSSVMRQRASEHARNATPPRKRQDDHGVCALESDLECSPIVPVEYPLLSGGLLGNNPRPLFPRCLDPAWLPVDPIQVDDRKPRPPAELCGKCRLAGTAGANDRYTLHLISLIE